MIDTEATLVAIAHCRWLRSQGVTAEQAALAIGCAYSYPKWRLVIPAYARAWRALQLRMPAA